MGESLPNAVRTALGFGAFVAVFLVIFPPIGFGEVPAPAFYWHAAVYGTICAAGMSLNLLALPRLFPRFFVEERWTISRRIALSLWNVVPIACGNLAYTIWQFRIALNFQAFAIFLFVTFLIGIFPVVILTLLKERRLMRRHIENASRVSERMHARLQREPQNKATTFPAKLRDKKTPETALESGKQPQTSVETAQATVVFEGTGAQERFEARARVFCVCGQTIIM